MRLPQLDCLRRLADDRRGAVALLFGLALMPVAAVTGAAIDYTHLSHDRADLQRAADAAAIAAAKAAREATGVPPTDAQLRSLAEDVVVANAAGAGLLIGDVDYRFEGGRHVVEVDASRKGFFGALLGADTSGVRVRADAAFEASGAPAEIAIVMDVTNSMKFGNRWRDATGVIADALERLRGAQGEFYVSLVPFSDRVNVSSVVDRASWLSGTLPGAGWNGCVEPRAETIGAFPHALDDDAPSGNDRFLATIAENMPDTHVGQRNGGGRLPSCASSPIVAPTTSIPAIETALNALRNTGTGRFDEGLAWGWRMLSPKWSEEWTIPGYPAPYGAREKIVMVFTDGQSTAYESEVLTGPAEAAVSPEGWTEFGQNKASPLGFAHLVDLCDRMKAAGVRVLMMQLEGNEHFTSYARACASSPEDYFFVSDVTSLETALAGVGLQSGGVRLVR